MNVDIEQVKVRVAEAIKDEGWDEPLYGSAAYVVVKKDVPALIAEVERLQSELDRITKERNAAVEDMKKMHSCGENCIFCKKFYACKKRLYEVGTCDDFEYLRV